MVPDWTIWIIWLAKTRVGPTAGCAGLRCRLDQIGLHSAVDWFGLERVPLSTSTDWTPWCVRLA
eukprot:3843740-Lingulodinium_polyedra.AAC.1